ncbi:hypothetical protein B0O99DRAFT_676888 [Bisporella sp. PMI_857]|nr:hypothetical protein B0O99DRAFT_676888 [Bisporella sp. PMI_857]
MSRCKSQILPHDTIEIHSRATCASSLWLQMPDKVHPCGFKVFLLLFAAMALTSTDNFRTQNLGPLTSTFTAPSTCLATTSVTAMYGGDSSYWVGFWGWVAPNMTTASDACVPPAETPTPLLSTWYYSPGICPSGYMPGASLATGYSISGCTSELPSSVTAWLCCPTGYTPSAYMYCGWQNTATCTSMAIGTATLTNVLPWLTTGSETFPNSIPTGEVVTKTVITESILTVMAVGIPIMWESTDTEVASWFAQASKGTFTPTISSYSSWSTRPYSSAYYTPPAYTYRPISTSSGGGGTTLSTLQLVGIGLSVGGVVLGILGCLLRPKKAPAQNQTEPVVDESAPEVEQEPPPGYGAHDHASRAV